MQWQIADAVAGLQSNGSAVAAWLDVSGAGATLASSSSSAAPLLVSPAYGSHAAVRFNASSLLSAGRGYLNSTNSSLLFVLAVPLAVHSSENFLTGPGGLQPRLGLLNKNCPVYTQSSVAIDGTVGFTSNAVPFVLSYLFNQQALAVQFFVNGQAAGGGNSTRFTPVTTSAWQLGGGFTGDVLEMMFFNTSLPSTSRAAVEQYLINKYS